VYREEGKKEREFKLLSYGSTKERKYRVLCVNKIIKKK
jgi:hypothetical protein